MTVKALVEDLELALPDAAAWEQERRGVLPAPFTAAALVPASLPSPALVCDLTSVVERLAAFRAGLPGVRVHYAVKCNPAEQVVAALDASGAGFEIASIGELALLRRLGVDPREVLYSNPVKPPAHIAAAHAAGVWRFCADGEGELRKLARHAPGAAVYLRLRVDDAGSAFPLSTKFGADPGAADELLLLARGLGLRPHGLTFHVGSQCTDPHAWSRAIRRCGEVMRRAAAHGVELKMLDLGGGFPVRYRSEVPGIDVIGASVLAALDELPYPVDVHAEPGRYLAAESGVLISEVIGREQRDGRTWIYLDVGAYGGLMESQQTGGRWDYPVWSSRPDHASAPTMRCTVTGPTCDSSDTVFEDVELPAAIDVGDRLYLAVTGAYTLSYASAFNGFPPPAPVYLPLVAKRS